MLQFLDSFDHYTTALEKWDSESGGTTPIIDTTVGRFLNGSLRVGGNSMSGNLHKKLTPDDEYITGCGFFFPSDTLFSIVFQTASGQAARITFDAPNIELRNAANTVVHTALSVITAATWQFVECRVKQHSSLGEIEVRVGGATVGSAITVNTGSVIMDEIIMDASATSDFTYIDDLYVLDTTGTSPQNTFLGDTRITVTRPKANGNNNNFTPTGAATNFDATNDALHDGDATFVEAGQIGAKEDYDNDNFSDLGLSPGTIFGVQTVNAAKKTDAGRLDYRDQMIIGGVTFDNGTDVISTSGSYKMTTFIRDTDPSDSAAWTEAKVDACGSGFEITFREI